MLGIQQRQCFSPVWHYNERGLFKGQKEGQFCEETLEEVEIIASEVRVFVAYVSHKQMKVVAHVKQSTMYT